MARSAVTRTGGRTATKGVIPGDLALSVGDPGLELPQGWRWTPLADLARLESGHTPSRRKPEYWSGDVPWVGIRDATENHGRVITKTREYTNPLGIRNSSARVLPPGTVCLSRTASIGYVVVMGREMATSQDFVNWVCSPRLSPHFLKYILLAEKAAFPRFASGTTHQTIYYPEVKAFHVACPPKAEQDRIAGALCALDDKIELNREMNRTLEAMAQAIFRSWFVDFDPVLAKSEGREPFGMDAETAAPFPDRFVESELGPIPEGWEVMTLADLADVNPDAIDRTFAFEEVLYVDISSVSPGEMEEPARMPMVSAPSRARRLVADWDVIWSCVRPNRRSYALIKDPPPNMVVSTGFAVLRAAAVPASWLYCMVTTTEFVDYLVARAHGSAYPAVRAETFQAARMLRPPKSVLDHFNGLVAPMLELRAANQRESQTLAALRDLLLPKLLSGEIRVPEAAEMAEDVA